MINPISSDTYCTWWVPNENSRLRACRGAAKAGIGVCSDGPYLISDRVRHEIELVELILHPYDIYALLDRCQRVLRILPNVVAFHPTQAIVKTERHQTRKSEASDTHGQDQSVSRLETAKTKSRKGLTALGAGVQHPYSHGWVLLGLGAAQGCLLETRSLFAVQAT